MPSLPKSKQPYAIVDGLFWDVYGRDCIFCMEKENYVYIVADGENVLIFNLLERSQIIEKIEICDHEGAVLWQVEPLVKLGLGITKFFANRCPDKLKDVSAWILGDKFEEFGAVLQEILLNISTEVYQPSNWQQIIQKAFHHHLRYFPAKQEGK